MAAELALIDDREYTIEDLRTLVATRRPIGLAKIIESNIARGASFVQAKAKEGLHIYGVNTGFGALCETRISDADMERLQYNHITSHAACVGDYASEEISRYSLLLKLLNFRSGHCGISLGTVHRLLDFWNRGAIPATPKKGTVGASGDVAPLAHHALPLLGLGEMWFEGSLVEASVLCQKFSWAPIRFQPKEGLALTNGVQYINAFAVACLSRIHQLIKTADVIAAFSAQAFSTSETYYQLEYQLTSRQTDRHDVARNFLELMAHSNHFKLETCNKSQQDPYSFRCIPQVHGAIRQVARYATTVIENEINSVSDNPLFFPDSGRILMGGALHGEPSAMAMDFLAIAVSELGSISERRVYQLCSGSRGLPDFLISRPGINSGMMLAQYTAAALVNENKIFSTPASIDTIPTSQLQEDHVSMGGTSAYKLCEVLTNVDTILAIELMLAAQAADLNKPLTLSPRAQEVLVGFRKRVPFLDEDRPLYKDISASRAYILECEATWTKGLA